MCGAFLVPQQGSSVDKNHGGQSLCGWGAPMRMCPETPPAKALVLLSAPLTLLKGEHEPNSGRLCAAA